MTWFKTHAIETVTGLEYDFDNPQASSVCLTDIAVQLGREPRFGGHKKFGREDYSVAQHSVLVQRILRGWGESVRVQVGGLFHDGHEAYLRDIPRPLKLKIGPEYKVLAAQADKVICEHFGFDLEQLHDPRVKEADDLALVHEARVLMRSGGPPEDPEPLPDGVMLVRGTGSLGAARLFLDAAAQLGVVKV